MAGFGFGNVGFVGSLTGGVASAPSPSAGVNRALQFVAASNQYVELNLPGLATALTGSTWSIELRVRLDVTTGGDYLLSRTAGGFDEYAIIYNFVANTVEFYSEKNGGRLALTTATPPGPAYQTIKFVNDGTTLTGYLNGVAAGSRAASPITSAPDNLLRLGCRSDAAVSGSSSSTLDYFRLMENGVTTVSADFNETTAPYANTGTVGGSFTPSASPPTSVLV